MSYQSVASYTALNERFRYASLSRSKLVRLLTFAEVGVAARDVRIPVDFAWDGAAQNFFHYMDSFLVRVDIAPVLSPRESACSFETSLKDSKCSSHLPACQFSALCL